MYKKTLIQVDRSLLEALKLGPSSTSPKMGIMLVSDLQDQIREHELKISSMSKTISRLEQENNDLLTLANEKDIELKKSVEELLSFRRSTKLKETNEIFSRPSKQAYPKSSNLHKLRNFYMEKSNKLEAEVKTFKSVFEEEKKIVENKLKIYSERETEYYTKIAHLERTVQQLQCEIKNLKEGENIKPRDQLEQDNSDLRRQLEIIRKAHNLHDLAMLSPDIHQISFQVSQLLTILQSLKAGKDISLKVLLTTDETSPVSSSKQLIADVNELKRNLSGIKQIVSDYHAEHLGFTMCITQ